MSSLRNLLSEQTGKMLFLLGNEAVARGAIEAGVHTATTYPGTPSSEVGDVLSALARDAQIYFEFSVNEKVALEVAFSSASSGLRSFVFMKHVGLNVASDPFMSIAYTGIKGGLVVMSADDPSMYSSQNEQDNRHYAEIAHVPLIEPSNSQEAKDYLVEAFEISESEHIPVLFRTTTRVSHQRSPVLLGPIRRKKREGHFDSGTGDYITLPSHSYRLKDLLLKKMERLQKVSSSSPLNRIERYGNAKHAIITSGAAYNVLMDTVKKYNLDVKILKLGFTNPFPEDLVEKFLKENGNVVVVEELDPMLETKTRTLAQIKDLSVKINGKMDGFFPMSHEYTPDIVARSLSKVMGFPLKPLSIELVEEALPARPPVLCPGCPHRATFYAIKRAVKMADIKEPIYSSDIGCYSLGAYDPFQEGDIILSMGTSIGAGSGFSAATDQRVISLIGDSTFFHTGIPPLINAVHNKARLLVVVLDNRTTAMTGRQPNPGMPIDAYGEASPEVSIESIAKAIGVNYVKTVDPYDLKSTLLAISEGLRQDGVSVVIARRECAIIRDNRRRAEKETSYYKVNQDKCSKCMNCIENFSCPAISLKDGEITIDQELCDACGVCAQAYVCPFRAIEEVVNDD